MTHLRILTASDRSSLQAFLVGRLDTTLFLQSNLAAAGLADEGHPHQGTYVAAVDGDRWLAVAAHYNGGNVVVAGDIGVEDAARYAVQSSRRPVKGVIGVWAEALRVLDALAIDRPLSLRSKENLYAVELADLRVPEPLAAGRVSCRPSSPDDLSKLTDWRLAFSTESLRQPATTAGRVAAHESVASAHALGRQWVLEDERGRPVATSSFNATTPRSVQVGGVFTPPDLRGQGFAKAVVAGSLLSARSVGASRSILFTGEENRPAQRAYQALGYERIGDYGILLF
jgi:predicted GNAT family acetyltransferase